MWQFFLGFLAGSAIQDHHSCKQQRPVISPALPVIRYSIRGCVTFLIMHSIVSFILHLAGAWIAKDTFLSAMLGYQIPCLFFVFGVLILFCRQLIGEPSQFSMRPKAMVIHKHIDTLKE